MTAAEEIRAQDLQAENERLRSLLNELIQGKRSSPVQVWYRVAWINDGTVNTDPPVRTLATAVQNARGRAEGGQNTSARRGADAWVERAIVEWEKIEDTEFVGIHHEPLR